MKLFNLRAISFGRPLIFLFTLCCFTYAASAQRLFSVSVESKTVHKGKMTIVNKDIYYRKDGNLNIRYTTSASQQYYSTTSPFGFTSIYHPSTKEASSLNPEFFKAEDELLFLFASGSGEDLGMARFGFVLKSTSKDGKFIVKRYEPKVKGGKCAWVELVLDENYLPVYCAYHDKKDKIITKTYLSNYTSAKDFVFPLRVTEISYLFEKNDSTVRLDLYRDLLVDTPDEMFNFHIPSDAKIVDLKEEAKSFSNQR